MSSILEWNLDIGSILPTYNLMLDGRMVGWVVKRPNYCDRGHWQFNCEISDIDGADGFPRYYMDLDRALIEAEEFVKWRLKL